MRRRLRKHGHELALLAAIAAGWLLSLALAWHALG
jgi:hypothetical protein